MDLNRRIAIIGAGAAGLTAAQTLREKGYQHITIFEKNSQAGGKCCSVVYQGRAYELGAGIVAANNTTILQLAQKFGMEFVPVEFGKSMLLDIRTGQPLGKKPLTSKLFTAHKLLFTYRQLTRQYRQLAAPGFLNVHSDVCLPFSAWAKKQHLEQVAEEFAPFFSGFGYGYFEDIPAAYVLKYYSWETVKSFAQRRMYKFPSGIQSLWTTVAKDHTILYNTLIKKIERNLPITISLSTQVLEFDELILTTPLDEFLDYGDADQEEKNLFSKIEYCDYRTYACILQEFPKESGYLPGNYHASRQGHPVFWYHRYADSDLYTFYVLGDWNISDEQVVKNIKQVVGQLSGGLERVHTIARWKYFPHVNSREMQNGFYDRLENLQGQQHTYYAGELMNFSTVGQSAAYAEHLVKLYF